MDLVTTNILSVLARRRSLPVLCSGLVVPQSFSQGLGWSLGLSVHSGSGFRGVSLISFCFEFLLEALVIPVAFRACY